MNRKPLSGYRFMWIQVLFDLPTHTAYQRKQASSFRNYLLDHGFEMAQYSVYQRFCSGKEMAEVHIKRVEQNLPEYGKVHILCFTDKQYENMRTFNGKKKNPAQENPGQFTLF
ncbi:MAG: CRISPR-associated endonuclease Cas2 [Candidatus Nitrohelix vancouverensis]|uniref:CRISPR-associated endoribonuclease Cas2 n=1 Tax=Candidatus Nitrohelix vancouverensis TaxID=2705534 RepID=A0A7T0C5B3_9BACT|nr:MAG: CRISPR-associated endonuclease Cas2 [Candidatus Nitrohelix vancouverensis]